MTKSSVGERIEFHVDRRRASVHAAGSLLALAAVVYVILVDAPEIACVAWPVLAAAGFMTVRGVRRALWRTPVVVIDDRGVDDRMSGLGLIPWAEIRGAGVTVAGQKRDVVVHVDHARTYTDRLWMPYRLVARLARSAPGIEFVTLRFTHLAPGADVAVQRIASYLRTTPHSAAGRCRRCGYDLQASPDCCPECGTPTRRN